MKVPIAPLTTTKMIIKTMATTTANEVVVEEGDSTRSV
jgi:hypothetical protein